MNLLMFALYFFFAGLSFFTYVGCVLLLLHALINYEIAKHEESFDRRLIYDVARYSSREIWDMKRDCKRRGNMCAMSCSSVCCWLARIIEGVVRIITLEAALCVIVCLSICTYLSGKWKRNTGRVNRIQWERYIWKRWFDNPHCIANTHYFCAVMMDPNLSAEPPLHLMSNRCIYKY